LKDGLGIASGLHEYYRNSDIIFMANYAQTVNVIGCIKTSKTAAEFATTGLVLKMYREHFGEIPVEVGGTAAPLDVMAALSRDRKILTIGIVNPTKETIELPLEIKGIELTGDGAYHRIWGPNEMSYNEPGVEPRVVIVEKTIKWDSGKLNVAPMSATVYTLRIK